VQVGVQVEHDGPDFGEKLAFGLDVAVFFFGFSKVADYVPFILMTIAFFLGRISRESLFWLLLSG